MALKEFEAKKSNEISRVCHRHYSEFIDSVEDLMKMKTDMVGLKDQVLMYHFGKAWATEAPGRGTRVFPVSLGVFFPRK